MKNPIRCSPRLRLAAACLTLALAAPWAGAQTLLRTLPPEAKKGEMQAPGHSDLVIDGKKYMIAPGIRIRDTNNMIVFPTSVTQAATVRYTLDSMGYVNRIWILSPQEKAMPDPKPASVEPAR